MRYFKYIIVLLIPVLFLCCNSGKTLEIFVSPTGDNSESGSITAPLATIEGAKLKVRELLEKNPNRNISVFFREGNYHLSETVVFSLEDSPAKGYNVSYESYNNEEVVFTSGIQISNWEKSYENESLPFDAVDRVYVADFPENVDAFYCMFEGDSLISRSKKEGFLIEDFKQKDLLAKSMNIYAPENRHFNKEFKFHDPENILKKVNSFENVELGFAPVPWNMNIIGIENIDFDYNTGYLELEANAPPGAKLSHTQPWIENAIEYISEGTFVADYKNRKIYYWPKNGAPSGNELVPSLIEYFKVEGKIDYDGPVDIPVTGINFKGLTFKHGDRYTWEEGHKGWGIQHDWDKFDEPNAFIRFRGAEDCKVEACRFTASGNSAIRLDLHAQNIVIENNLIDYVGHMGILLCGYGPGTKDVNKNNVIKNNLIHHVGQVIKHGAAVFIWQSGDNMVCNNLIHHVPRKGVGICGIRMPILEKQWCDYDEGSKTIRWDEIELALKGKERSWENMMPFLHARNNIIEFNEVYRALEELADGSVLNVSGAGEGNIVRNNYVHHIASKASGVLRTDDWQRGTLFEENIIYKTNVAGIVHKGFNHINNNLLIDCSTLEYIRFASYPDEVAAYGSSIKGNVFYETESGMNLYKMNYIASEGISKPEDCDIDNSIIYCKGNPEVGEEHIEEWKVKGIEDNSLVLEPKVIVEEDNDIVFLENSPVLEKGLTQAEFNKIGLENDFPIEFLNLDTNFPEKKVVFHRNKDKANVLYEFW